MSEKKKKFTIDDFADKLGKILEPLANLSNTAVMQSLMAGFIGTLPVTIVGSIFLILTCAITGDLGFPAITSLMGITGKLGFMYSLTFSMITIYAVLGIAVAYSKHLKINEVNGVILAFAMFMITNYNSFENGIDPSRFGPSSMIVSIVVTILSVRIFAWFKDHNLTIKLPPTVPTNIVNSFTSLIPYLVLFTVGWLFRTVLEIDFVTIISDLIKPLFGAADNIVVYTVDNTVNLGVWGLGIHYSSMVSGIRTPLTYQWLAENAEAFMAGTARTALPHINVANMYLWAQDRPGCIYPMLFLTIFSKNEGLRALGRTVMIPVFFCVGEPLLFGLPYVMNPFMIIPAVITSILSSIFSWLCFSLGFVNKVAVDSPWAAPVLLTTWLQTGGDLRAYIMIGIEFVVGVLIYLPFFRAYEKTLDNKGNAIEGK